MVETTGLNTTVVVTPPASATKSGKGVPSSGATAAETPTAGSPDSNNIRVVKLDDSSSEDSAPTTPRKDDYSNYNNRSIGSITEESDSAATTPKRVGSSSGSKGGSTRGTLLSQMQDAIPSPDSVANGKHRFMELDVSALTTPPLPETPPTKNASRFVDGCKMETDSQETPVKPSKLYFPQDPSKRDLHMVAPAPNKTSPGALMHPLSGLSVPYAMAPVDSYASQPFDCVEDAKRKMFPPRPEDDSDEELFVDEDYTVNDKKDTAPKPLVRTLFGWVETAVSTESVKSTTPIKARVLSDRDVGLNHPRDRAFVRTTLTEEEEEEPILPKTEELEKRMFRPSLDGPGHSALVASKWFGSGTQDEEDEPGHIDHVKEAIAEALEKKREVNFVEEKKKRPPRNWYNTCLYAGIIVVMIIIVIISSMLLAGNARDEKKAASAQDDGDDSLFPGGFYSTTNQFCTGAAPLTELGVVYSGTTKDSAWDDSVDKCGDFMSTGRSSWFVYKAETSQMMEASTCGAGTDFDTRITVGSGRCEQLTCVTFNDQACGDQSRAVWYAQAGRTYYINVHGYRMAKGNFELVVQPTNQNDQCNSAFGPVAVGSTVYGTTSGSNLDNAMDQCGDVNLQQTPGVWYRLADLEGWLRAEVVSRHSGFLPQVSVYSGVGCSLLACEGGSSTGSLAFKATSGMTYYILVNGLNTAKGDFDLSLSWEYQDACEFATPLPVNGPAFAATTTAARLHDVPPCGEIGYHTAPGMWFSVTGTGNMLSATTCGKNSELDSHVSVFRNGCTALQCVGSTGQDLPCGASGAVSWFSESETEYIIYVSGRGGRVGDFTLSITDSSTQAGEMCQTSVALGSGTITVTGSTVDAETTSNVCGNITSAEGVWYEFVGTGSTMTLWTCDPQTTFDARVSVFTGTCTSLTCEYASSASCSELSNGPSQFTTVAGVKYHMLVHGSEPDMTGSFSLTMSDAATNEACASATLISADTNTYFGSTTDVTDGRAIFCADGEDTTEGPKGVWYTFEGTGGRFSFSTCSENTEFATAIDVFSGACLDPECVETEYTACGFQGVATFSTVQGETYFVRVSAANADESGSFVLSVSVKNLFFGW